MFEHTDAQKWVYGLIYSPHSEQKPPTPPTFNNNIQTISFFIKQFLFSLLCPFYGFPTSSCSYSHKHINVCKWIRGIYIFVNLLLLFTHFLKILKGSDLIYTQADSD